MRTYFFLIFLLICQLQQAQEEQIGISLSLDEYLAYVKLYHPVARQAELRLSAAQAERLRARGFFDPTVKADYKEKEFNESDYYNIFNAGLSIPVWFGLDINAGFENNEGVFLNPERNVPDGGLYKAGVSLPLGQGLFINDRMAAVKQAKLIQKLNKAERDLQINDILFTATLAYIDWYRANQEVQIFSEFVDNARIRFEGIKESALQGDIPVIDTLEAKIIVQDRELNLEQASLRRTQSRLEIANFLWFENNTPLQVNPGVLPEDITQEEVDEILGTNLIQVEEMDLDNHPLLEFLSTNVESLDIERRLAAENLKPVLDVSYNFLSTQPDQFETYTTNNYQAAVTFSIPVFLRKERGELKLAKIRKQDAEMEYDFQTLQLRNRLEAAQQEIISFGDQRNQIDQIAVNFSQLLSAEEQKFQVGESSVFLINAREQQLIDAQLNLIQATARLLQSKARMFNLLANDLATED